MTASQTTTLPTLGSDSAAAGTTLTFARPDDWHVHLRDDQALTVTVPHCANTFNRVICMPNLVPPVKTAADALAYRERIITALQNSGANSDTLRRFDPRMTLYLTDNTTEADIKQAYETGMVQAVKLYPAGATTNSADGVTDILKCGAVFEALQQHQMPLLIHGEVTHGEVDIFDREKRFLDEVLSPLIARYPALKIVVEHITTSDAANFVLAQGQNVAATITPQHLLYNRNHIFVGGIKPHLYCLPVLKRQSHQKRLLEVAVSGSPKFFLGTDSAPHATHAKENACGCAGCYSAPHALALYATAFDSVGKIDKLPDFASTFGAAFYNLPKNTDTITLIKSDYAVPISYDYINDSTLTPLAAGETLPWQIAAAQSID